jgi:predicted aspartyl protease
MLAGSINRQGLPEVQLALGGRFWPALIDTGFNGDLELPDSLKAEVSTEYVGQHYTQLAAGQIVVEDVFRLAIDFDGRTEIVDATFAPGGDVLIGTHLLRRHLLVIDFRAETVALRRP